MNIKFTSRQVESTSGGVVTSLAWNGTYDEMMTVFNNEAIGFLNSEYGKLQSVRLFQESPEIWCCEKRYSTGTNGVSSDKPLTVYGKKSATLKGSMLSMPLESHPKYKACWNHFLAIAPGESATPSWWKTASDTNISSTDAKKYAWIKTPGEAPVDPKGDRWRTVAPTKPGVETYDVAVYSVTETSKHSSANSAGKSVSGKLNSIGSPGTKFGISGGNWKCDDASVFYDGQDWFSTVTWTLSGNSDGWDKDLY